METPFIIILLVILIIIIVLFYYFMFIKSNNITQNNIPQELIYEHNITITELFNNISKKYGNYPALKYNINDNWKTVSYNEYYNISYNIAQKLSYYISPRTIVGILSNNRPEWFYIHMGTMIANGLPIGIDSSCTPNNCSFIINKSNIELLVLENIKQLQKLYNIKTPTVKVILLLEDMDKTDIINKDILDNIRNNNPNIKIWFYEKFMNKSLQNYFINTSVEFGSSMMKNNATIIYTPGTTGKPKGVIISHKNIMNSIKSSLYNIESRSNINIYTGEKILSNIPLNHIVSQLFNIYIPIASVGTVYIVNNFDNSLFNTLQGIQPTIFMGTSDIWNTIMDMSKNYSYTANIMNQLLLNKYILRNIGLDYSKYCISVGLSMSQEIKYFFGSIGIELCNVYGMTETTGLISMGVPGCSRGSGIPIIDIKIDNKTNEILVKGDSVFSGYINDVKNIVSKKGWFNTGDTGYIDRDGSLFVSGRIKDMIITLNGKNIYPEPIEQKLLSELNINDKLFEYVILLGNQQKFLSVLLVPSINNINCDNSQILKTINDVDDTILKYKIINYNKFDKNECCTPTLKLRRNYINDKYKNIIDSIYL
jgi:long-subunit acyl-CoA synthetase (AMP-forming)